MAYLLASQHRCSRYAAHHKPCSNNPTIQQHTPTHYMPIIDPIVDPILTPIKAATQPAIQQATQPAAAVPPSTSGNSLASWALDIRSYKLKPLRVGDTLMKVPLLRLVENLRQLVLRHGTHRTWVLRPCEHMCTTWAVLFISRVPAQEYAVECTVCCQSVW